MKHEGVFLSFSLPTTQFPETRKTAMFESFGRTKHGSYRRISDGSGRFRVGATS